MSDEEALKELDRRYPPYPVNHDQVRSLAHSSTRAIQIEPDGSITSDVLMKKVPETQEEADKLRAVVLQNPPFIYGRLVSWDEQGALVSAGFITDRLSNSPGLQAVFNHVQAIKTEFEDPACAAATNPGYLASMWNAVRRVFVTAETKADWPEGCNLQIFVSGEPIHVGWIIKHAFEIGLYVVLTTVVIFALLLAYFRRLHGVLIPFVAAIITVIWGTGFTGWTGITFDPLVLVIPMIITARAVSHTVQMAERFFEDFEILAPRYADPNDAKIEAATIAMAELIVPGTLGIVVDVGGLLVILVTSIPQMRDLAKFGAFWVTSILFTVEILHPVMISYLPAPKEHEHFLPTGMVRAMRFVGWITTHPKWKYVLGVGTILIFITSTYITLMYSKIGQVTPGSPLLWPDHPFNVATDQIAQALRRRRLVRGLHQRRPRERQRRSAADPAHDRVRALDAVLHEPRRVGVDRADHPRLLANEPLRRSEVAVRAGASGHRPDGDLPAPHQRRAGLPAPVHDRRFEGRERLVLLSRSQGRNDPPGGAGGRRVHQGKPDGRGDRAPRHGPRGKGASFFSRQKLTDIWYYMLGPLLPPRNHTLNVQVKKSDGKYESIEVTQAATGAPPWLGEFREKAIADYEAERDSVEEGEYFSWPKTLADWEEDDVDAYWESQEHGIRAVAVNTKDLIVQDLKAVEPTPKYQPTNSWTRGVQFVMAGGIMGILAAINDEVERSHIANITLIFAVIFCLHSLTYWSFASGGIIFLQIATATLVSLAYMAIRGVGLNINTLPVQSVGVGIGVDYAIYIVDRIRQEVADTSDIDEAVRRAVRTTGHGRFVHGHHGGGRHRAVVLLEPALPGGDGAAAHAADDREHARRDHHRADLLLDPAAAGGDGAAHRRAAGGHAPAQGTREGSSVCTTSEPTGERGPSTGGSLARSDSKAGSLPAIRPSTSHGYVRSAPSSEPGNAWSSSRMREAFSSTARPEMSITRQPRVRNSRTDSSSSREIASALAYWLEGPLRIERARARRIAVRFSTSPTRPKTLRGFRSSSCRGGSTPGTSGTLPVL